MTKKQIVSAIITVYVVGCFLQNILAVKTFSVFGLPLTTGGTLISWIVFACMDIITELRGKKTATKIFTAAMIGNIVWSLLCWIAIALPGTNQFVNDCYAVVLGSSWRITIASAVAFWLGNYTNTSIMSKMRHKHGDKKYCLRAVVSTIFGQATDNVLFYFLAFSPIGITATEMELKSIFLVAISTTLLETVLEAVISPATKKITAELR